jgi:Protein of unknown function (DUF2889)
MGTAVVREELHHRRIDMRGYRRSDGLYEIEGRVTDRKPHDFEPVSGGRAVPAHEPIHDMGVRLVYDDQFTVREVETFTDASPYQQCPLGGLALRALVGVRMTSGWSREVRSRLASAESCTHLRELLLPMATAAFQSMSVPRRGRPDPVDATGRPLKIDSCYAYSAKRELVRQRWPEYFHAGPEFPDGKGFEE